MMAVPRIFRAMNGIEQEVTARASFMLLYGMPVMLGWAIILLWADRKPLERYGVFLCLIPVLLAYVGVEIYGIARGHLSLGGTLPTFAMQAVLISLSTVSYIWAKNIKLKMG